MIFWRSIVAQSAARPGLQVPLLQFQMAALVASPLYLPSRDGGGDNRSQSNTGTGENPLFSSGQTSELGLARFTNNPIVFVKASEPTLTSVPLSSKYEILDDSKLDVSKTPSMTAKARLNFRYMLVWSLLWYCTYGLI